MRGLVLLCLLYASSFYSVRGNFSWNGPENNDAECVLNNSTCGCCLMREKMKRMKDFLNQTETEINSFLQKSNTTLNTIRECRSAFSVALNNEQNLTCFGPFSDNRSIVYNHTFLNSGNSYDGSTGVFTAPCSGVYSLAVTIYSTDSTGANHSACAHLQVKGHSTRLQETYEGDPEDSNTIVVSVKLKAGDQVVIKLVRKCMVCDDKNHYNTFTGFLVYATE